MEVTARLNSIFSSFDAKVRRLKNYTNNRIHNGPTFERVELLYKEVSSLKTNLIVDLNVFEEMLGFDKEGNINYPQLGEEGYRFRNEVSNGVLERIEAVLQTTKLEMVRFKRNLDELTDNTELNFLQGGNL